MDYLKKGSAGSATTTTTTKPLSLDDYPIYAEVDKCDFRNLNSLMGGSGNKATPAPSKPKSSFSNLSSLLAAPSAYT